jgi:hypothetical protein
MQSALRLLSCFVVLGGSGLRAQLVQWTSGSGANNHYYELVLAPGGITWSNAATAAQNAGGYLATLTSGDENAFVYNLAAGNDSAWFIDTPGNGIGPWLGGQQTSFTSEPAGGWVWITGETWSETNWAANEPSNVGGVEDKLQLFGVLTLKAPNWNDMANNGNAPDGPARSYIIEYNVNPIPEPSTYALFIGVAVIGLALWRRRRTSRLSSV